jgi:DNA-binding NarL/FixJ family response regulator
VLPRPPTPRLIGGCAPQDRAAIPGRQRRTAPPSPARGIQALTPQERRIADLAAHDLTNRQIAQEL